MRKKTDNMVKESNALARARIMPPSISVWEERIISTIAARNRTDDLDFREQAIRPEELTQDGKVLADEFRRIKISIDRLSTTRFCVPTGRRGIMIYPIFTKIGVEDDGTIVGKLNAELKQHYLELKKQFTIRSLPDFQGLSSTYSQMLYRFLCSWHKTNPEITLGLDELHNLLDTPPALKRDFTEFRRRVLEVAHREINAVAQNSTEDKPLEFDWEPVKKGLRKVVAVRFIFNVSGRRMAEKAGEVLATIRNQNAENGNA